MTGLLLVFAAMVIIIIILVVALLYVLKYSQDKENRAAQPDARLLKIPGNKKVNLNTMVLTNFLEQADDAYIAAYQRSNVEIFIPYCTIPLAMDLNNKIIYCNDKTFGLESHRNRRWTILEVGENSLVVRKEITFDRIKERGKRAYITYADPINEVWRIGYGPSRFQVQEVKEIV